MTNLQTLPETNGISHSPIVEMFHNFRITRNQTLYSQLGGEILYLNENYLNQDFQPGRSVIISQGGGIFDAETLTFVVGQPEDDTDLAPHLVKRHFANLDKTPQSVTKIYVEEKDNVYTAWNAKSVVTSEGLTLVSKNPMSRGACSFVLGLLRMAE